MAQHLKTAGQAGFWEKGLEKRPGGREKEGPTSIGGLTTSNSLCLRESTTGPSHPVPHRSGLPKLNSW